MVLHHPECLGFLTSKRAGLNVAPNPAVLGSPKQTYLGPMNLHMFGTFLEEHCS